MMKKNKNKTTKKKPPPNSKTQCHVNFFTPTQFPLSSLGVGPWTRLILPTATAYVSAPN